MTLSPPGDQGSQQSAQDSRQGDIAFISLLRGLASLLVVWDHLVAGWNDQNHRAFLPLEVSRQYLTKPLAIIQDFGYLGVATFFFVSGFIITHVGRREGQLAFFIKRLLRIYPPLLVSMLLILPIAMMEARATGTPYEFSTYRLGDYLRAFTLWNYFDVPDKAINGVAWTLAIEVLFYLFCLVMLPLLKSMPVAASGFMTAFCAVVLLRAHDLGDRFFLFADVSGHLPLLLLGQATYLLWAKLARGWQFTLLAVVNYLVFIIALRQVHAGFFAPSNSYGVSTTFAYLLFVIAMLLGPRLRLPRIIGFYSKISYSLYLLHGAVGIALLDLLVGRIGFVPALLVALLAVTLCSYLSWRWIEQPSQRLARNLLGKSGSPATNSLSRKAALVMPLLLLAVGAGLLVPVFKKPYLLEAEAGGTAQAGLDAPDELSPAAATTQPAALDPDAVDGTLDAADASVITGWGWNALDPHGHVEVAVSVDGKLAGYGQTNHFRDDLEKAGKGDGQHAFFLKSPAVLSDGKPHQVSVRVLGADRDLMQSPMTVPASVGK
jgi:peptidoglycan/LPS O-acetylase OafA/YrhL